MRRLLTIFMAALGFSIAANAYLKCYHLNAPIRFDIITVTGTPDTSYTINHIPNAFYPPRR